MPSYLVTITSTILVEAENETDAEVTAAGCFDFGSAEFNTEEMQLGGRPVDWESFPEVAAMLMAYYTTRCKFEEDDCNG